MPGRINYTSGTLNKAKKVRRGTFQQLPQKPLFAPPRLTEEVEVITEASLSEAGAPKLSVFGEDEEEKMKIKWNYSWARVDGQKKGNASRKFWFIDFDEGVLVQGKVGNEKAKQTERVQRNLVENVNAATKDKFAILKLNLSGLPDRPLPGRRSRNHSYLDQNPAPPQDNAVTSGRRHQRGPK